MKIKIAKKFWKPGQLEVDKSEFSDWSSLTGAASDLNHLFVALIFSSQPFFCRFDEILYLQNAIFTLNVYNGQSQSVPGAFTVHVLFWECWNDDPYCIVENTSSA